jgi:Major Facilitator Superfamily
VEATGSGNSYWERLREGFLPPALPPLSRRAFRFQMAFTLLYAVFEGVMANAPLIAVKAMDASDIQLQMPLAMASIGLFVSALLGVVMARRRKKLFVVVPGMTGALAAMTMSAMPTAGGFLFMAGLVSICDFAMRPAVPSVMRIVYPAHCRSRVSGSLRQYGSIAFLAATLLSATLLSRPGTLGVPRLIRIEMLVAAATCAAAFLCFARLPDHGDGSEAEAEAVDDPKVSWERAALKPWQDRRFLGYLAAIFVFSFANLFHQGVVPSYFARDLRLGYVQTTLLIHVIPNLTAFFAGGFLTSWFERTSVWRSYSLVTLLWGLDPLIIATAAFSWPALILARSLRGPATLGSMVIAFFTGVHTFARPGSDTSRYMSAQFLVNGVARLVAPVAAGFALAYLTRRSIIFCGSLGILASSVMFWWYEKRTPVANPTIELAGDNA